jgi:hypothetical protein
MATVAPSRDRNLNVLFPKALLIQIDEHVERLRKKSPYSTVTRSDALRDLVMRGLADAHH